MSTQPSPVVLQSGDHLTREEFHRRYCLRPDIKKAELVQGVVYVASPVRHVHGKPHAIIMSWLGHYVARTPGIELSDNGTVLLDVDSEVQPDAFLFRVPPPGLRAARLTGAGYVEGAPQLVVEVAASSAALDLRAKRDAYRRSGVQEYLVWRTERKLLDWFRLQPDGTYERVAPDALGVIESSQFPGLRLNVATLLAEDIAGVLAGLDSPRE